MVPPINTNKHMVHLTAATVTNGTILNTTVVDSVAAPSAANAVQEGAVIKAVFIELWINGSGATNTHSVFSVTVEKIPAAAPSMTFAQSANLGAYPNKKNILYTTQGILAAGIDGAQSIPVIRQWIAIPKGKQRFGLADQLMLNTSAPGSIDLIICGIQIYKEFK